MEPEMKQYRAMISSDWSECLSPNGPFDPIAFTYPQMADDLRNVFQDYTSNRISLTEASRRISSSMPGPLTEAHVDAYLDASFATYKGVPELIRWCTEHDILFMLNTTGTRGYFRRVFARGLLPPVHAVASNPLIDFPGSDQDDRYVCDVKEIDDKSKCTETVLQARNVQAGRLFIMGDSGGDGAHFRWGASVGAVLIASMAKVSLKKYCEATGIAVNHFFGLSYEPGMPRDHAAEMQVDFMDLARIIEG